MKRFFKIMTILLILLLFSACQASSERDNDISKCFPSASFGTDPISSTAFESSGNLNCYDVPPVSYNSKEFILNGSESDADKASFFPLPDTLNGVERHQYIKELFLKNDVDSRIVYVNYLVDYSIKPDSKWLTYFKELISEQYPNSNTPVIIQESWTIEIEGTRLSLVTASNVVKESYMNESYAKPVDSNTGLFVDSIIYLYSEIFIDGVPMYSVRTSKILQISSAPLSSNNGLSFTRPGEYGEDDYGFFICNCFQNDSALSIVSCYTNIHVYNEILGVYFYFPKLYYADIDNDLIPEIGIEYTGPSSLYSSFELFTLIDNRLEKIDY